jgi:hypothetical protein
MVTATLHTGNGLRAMLDLYEAYEQVVSETRNPDVEPFFDQYRGLFEQLNRIATSTGELIEGSLFNDDSVSELPLEPVTHLRYRRRNFAKFVATGRNLLEVGFNVGHSALLSLIVNPSLVYTGIDIGKCRYTHLCYDFLKRKFGSRVQLYIGDSRDILPRTSSGKFDRFHIDGGHSPEVSHSDLASTMKIADINSLILFDDAAADYVVSLISFYILTGHLRIERLPGSWEHGTHRVLSDQALLRVCKTL